MGKRDERIDAYIARSAPFAQPVLAHLRKAVHAGCPGVQETIKWGSPHFMYKGMLCAMAAFKAHCAFGFWKGALLKGLPGLGREAAGQFGRITSVEDLPPEKEVIGMVRQAAALNDHGVKAPKRRKPERRRPRVPARPPADLADALRKNKAARSTFDALSPSHKREYVEWISEAKREETRKRRVETAIAWMAEGKSRNWKYAP
jgi:uncharacterized protein YdeI (YjbR/CyaY-like superfamily)